MLRLGKKAEYGLIALRHLAAQRPRASCSAKEIARTYGMPAELVAKVLQRLAKIGLLASQHGTNGGYALAKDPAQINAFEVIRALEGPLFITSCVTDRSECHQMTKCTVREPLRKVNEAIATALRQLTVASLVVEPHSLIQIQAEGKRP
jgi:Rrf2 family protein